MIDEQLVQWIIDEVPAWGKGTTILWAWYAGLCVIAVLNLCLLAKFWSSINASDGYQQLMKILAIPWVFECAWRSVFPSLYLQRFVFWDTFLNSIIVDRTLAFVGELCWVSQFAFALRHTDKDIAPGGHPWVQTSGLLAIFVYVLAEAASYYNTATTNELWCAIEVVLDGISYLCMAPGAIYLLCKCPGTLYSSSAKVFLALTSVICIAYPLYNFSVDAPMYLTRYRADQAAHKHYMPFLRGLEDAATRRIPTHDVEDWKEDMTWMFLYFSFGAWSGLALMVAPRLPSSMRNESPTALAVSFVPL